MNYWTVRMIRELRGTPLSVVLALQCAHQRVSQAWLERATGYTDKPVSQALAYLAEIGMVDHTLAGWGLAGGRQMVLGEVEQIEEGEDYTLEDTEITEKSPIHRISGYEDDSLDQDRGELEAEIIEGGRNLSDSLITATAAESIDSVNQPAAAVIKGEKVGKNPLWAVFRECGIGLNARTTRLAAMSHVTEAYVRGHIEALREDEGVGLAIFRMEQGDTVPGQLVRELVREKNEKQARSRYGQWDQDRKS